LQLIEVLHTIASKIASGLFQADNNFEAQKQIFHLLNVQATLSVSDGKKKVKVTCELEEIGNSFTNDGDANPAGFPIGNRCIPDHSGGIWRAARLACS
jgi:hypothetical protein